MYKQNGPLFPQPQQGHLNHLKMKMAPVVCFKYFFQRNPYFFSQIRKEINPLEVSLLNLGMSLRFAGRIDLPFMTLRKVDVFLMKQEKDLKGRRETSWPCLNA